MNFFWKLNKEDWKILLICIGASLLFWLLIAMNDSYNIDVTHPLRIEYDEDEYVPLSKLPQTIRFNTTASGWDLLRKTSYVSSADPVVLNINDFKKKRYITSSKLYPIVSKQMKGIKVNYILDDTIFVHFNYLKEKKISLYIPPDSIKLGQNQILNGEIVVEPSTVVISGPESLINKVPSRVPLKIRIEQAGKEYEETFVPETNLDSRIDIKEDKVLVRFKTIELEKFEKEIVPVKVHFPMNSKKALSSEVLHLTGYCKPDKKQVAEQYKYELRVDYNKKNEKGSIKPELTTKPPFLIKYIISPQTVQLRDE